MFVNIAIVESCSFVIEKLCPDIFQTIPLPMVQNQSTKVHYIFLYKSVINKFLPRFFDEPFYANMFTV